VIATRLLALAGAGALAALPLGGLAAHGRGHAQPHGRAKPAARAKTRAGGPVGRATAQPEIVRKIAISVNGDALPTETPPIVVDGRVLVPLRVVFDALGIDVTRSGRTIAGALPTGAVTIVVGSSVGSIDERRVAFDVPVIDTNGTTYASLRVIHTVLGADAAYDQRAARVTIVSGAVGRAPSGQSAAAHGGTSVQGDVAAVDTNSQPPSIAITAAGSLRTISVTSNAKLFVEDVTIHTQIPATLADVRVGDALRAVLARDGRVVEVHDFFKSASGVVSAVSASAAVLANGRVVQPAMTTEISLNDGPAALGDLHVGDFLTVRSNPETGELRQVIASRTGVATPAATGAAGVTKAVPSIAGVTLSRARALHAGESLAVTLSGTPGGQAQFDIGDFVPGLPMQETTPGTYVGRFTIPSRFNVAEVPVYGHLSVGGVNAPKATAAGAFSAATTPPQISDVAPPSGQSVNNARPSIFATFATPSDIGVDVGSAQIVVNGHDVTSSSTRTNGFITYSPGVDYADGPVQVAVRVADLAGNVVTRSWTFTIKTR